MHAKTGLPCVIPSLFLHAHAKSLKKILDFRSTMSASKHTAPIKLVCDPDAEDLKHLDFVHCSNPRDAKTNQDFDPSLWSRRWRIVGGSF